jgi:hypothetical protein
LDANQTDIVDELLKHNNVSVFSLAGVANGCPDLLVGVSGRTYLVEVKDGDKPPSKQELTPDQRKWFANWKGGMVMVLHSVDEARSWVNEVTP